MQKNELKNFLEQAIDSRLKHTVSDRLIALEVMTCAIGASLEDDARKKFLKVMNSFSENLDPMAHPTIKAIADLNVLSGDFNSLSNRLADKK